MELTFQTKTALNVIQFIIGVNLLHVFAPGCHPRGNF